MKQEIISYLNSIKDEIYNITKFLCDNPEESYKGSKSFSLFNKYIKEQWF